MDERYMLREQLRNYLNQNKIKLWLEPYTKPDGSKGSIPNELIQSIRNLFSIEESNVNFILEELRSYSVCKLVAQKKFNETGLAQLKIKIAGNSHKIVSLIDLTQEITVELDLNKNVDELMNKITEITSIPSDYIKFIANGQMIQHNLSLASQNIQNFCRILGICLNDAEIESLLEDKRQDQMKKVKEATQYLIESNNNINDESQYYLQISDQNGRLIKIPKDEQKALTVAMLMHEKGRSALKNKNYGLALTYLAEADSEFKKCSTDILNLVDNFALVCLDLVWCYFCLQNITHLQDAKQKLQIAEEMFKKSYGENFQRVSHVKGSCEQERALFLRLHILQAVAAFFNSDYSLAKQLLNKAESDLKRLKVDETKLIEMMEIGFDLQESRLALRFANNDLNAAVQHITKIKEDREEIRKKEKHKKELKILEKKLGLTNAGLKINTSFYSSLLSMGFDRRAVLCALRETENDFFDSLKHLHDNSHIDINNLYDPEAQPTQAKSEASISESSSNVPTPFDPFDVSSISSSIQSVTDYKETIEKEIVPDISDSIEDYLDLLLDEEEAIIVEYKARILSQAK